MPGKNEDLIYQTVRLNFSGTFDISVQRGDILKQESIFEYFLLCFHCLFIIRSKLSESSAGDKAGIKEHRIVAISGQNVDTLW